MPASYLATCTVQSYCTLAHGLPKHSTSEMPTELAWSSAAQRSAVQ